MAMVILADAAKPPLSFRPPAVALRPRPLPLPSFVAALIRNPIAAWPQQILQEPVLVQQVLGQTIVSVSDPDLLRAVFQDSEGRFSKNPLERRLLGPILGEGILIAEGESWRWQRRVAAPLFRHAELLRYVPLMADAARDCLAQWRRDGPSGRRRVDQAMLHATFAVIARAMLPRDDAICKVDAVERWLAQYLAPVSWELAFGLLQLPTWVPYPGKRRGQRAARSIRSEFEALMERPRRDSQGVEDLLARMIRATDPASGCPMSRARLVDNLVTFLLAGHETTAITLTWALYLLANASAWQQLVAEEARSVAGDGAITSAHVDELVLTRQVIMETMRLYPPVPILSRLAQEDFVLDGQRFARGTMVFVPVYAIHRHRRLWTEPDRFDPARFAPDAETQHKRFAYLPFGAGSRICMGASFAMMEATVILATLIRAAHFTAPDNYHPQAVARITLRPRGGMVLGVTLRR